MLKEVIKEAEKWIGYLEKKSNKDLEHFTKNAGSNNYTIFAQQYKQYFNLNFQGQPWCAMFVSCVFRNALGQKTQETIMPHFSYCPTGVNQFKKLNCWHVSNPQVGDVIFFKDSSGIACHVGIVDEVLNNKVYTIEGNTSDKIGVIANGGAVCKKSYSINYNNIMGYGRPAYKILNPPPWQQEFLEKLVNKGYIQNPETWSDYNGTVTKGLTVALIDKITGGKWDSDEENKDFHWAQPHVISLCGKKIIQNKEEWLNSLDAPITKAFVIALIDKATGGIREEYKNVSGDHWARAHLNSLCDKGIINTPEVWCANFDSVVEKGNFMALLCKAYNI